MVMSLHDIPGKHKVDTAVQKLAAVTQQDFPCFDAPFKCAVKKVTVKTGANWVGVNSADNYNRIVLLDAGAGGMATPTALGTISGGPAGTPCLAFQPATLYEPATPLACDAGRVLVIRMGTVGTGTIAAPNFTTEVEFEAR